MEKQTIICMVIIYHDEWNTAYFSCTSDKFWTGKFSLGAWAGLTCVESLISDVFPLLLSGINLSSRLFPFCVFLWVCQLITTLYPILKILASNVSARERNTKLWKSHILVLSCPVIDALFLRQTQCIQACFHIHMVKTWIKISLWMIGILKVYEFSYLSRLSALHFYRIYLKTIKV